MLRYLSHHFTGMRSASKDILQELYGNENKRMSKMKLKSLLTTGPA